MCASSRGKARAHTFGAIWTCGSLVSNLSSESNCLKAYTIEINVATREATPATMTRPFASFCPVPPECLLLCVPWDILSAIAAGTWDNDAF